MFTLIIGNKNYSSWSLRPWLVLKMLDEPFEEQQIDLYLSDTKARILAANPAGKVPVLIDRKLRVWDSLAICEYLAECFPAAKLWPDDAGLRAVARSIVARDPLRLLRPARTPGDESDAAPYQLPKHAGGGVRYRPHHLAMGRASAAPSANGEFIFGGFSIADAFFAPIATRFHTYNVKLPEQSQAYVNRLLALPAMREWYDAAQAEGQRGQ
ncbi:glutathione S-transferase N-terminal domain-containing protein [Chromobacterium haemolyticum]|nr:glutathione S-transferase N-terminal domain-containing protein [Chromobacterium haemolyticum]